MVAKKNLLVIGDSISIQYGPWLASFVKDYFHYDRRGGKGGIKAFEPPDTAINSGDSASTLEYVQAIIANGCRPDLMVINCGLHDLKTNPETGKKQVGLDCYQQHLREIFRVIREAAVNLLWVRITPVVDNIHNRGNISFHRYNQDVLNYNRVADEIAEEYSVSSIDLYGFTEKLSEDTDIYCDHVHFTDDVRMLQAAFIAGHILAYDFGWEKTGK